MPNSNNSQYEFFCPEGNKITEVSNDVVLTYKEAGKAYQAGAPSISKGCEIKNMMNGWRLRFDLISPDIKAVLPADDYTQAWDIGAKDNGGVGNELVQVILPLSPDQIAQIETILKLQPKVHSFARCKDNFTKICCNCTTGCPGPETFEATPDASLWLLQEGMLNKDEVDRDMENARTELGNNKELLKAYIQYRSQGLSHDEALKNCRAMINASIEQPTGPVPETPPTGIPIKDQALADEAKRYALDNKVSYETALLKITKGK